MAYLLELVAFEASQEVQEQIMLVVLLLHKMTRASEEPIYESLVNLFKGCGWRAEPPKNDCNYIQPNRRLMATIFHEFEKDGIAVFLLSDFRAAKRMLDIFIYK